MSDLEVEGFHNGELGVTTKIGVYEGYLQSLRNGLFTYTDNVIENERLWNSEQTIGLW